MSEWASGWIGYVGWVSERMREYAGWVREYCKVSHRRSHEIWCAKIVNPKCRCHVLHSKREEVWGKDAIKVTCATGHAKTKVTGHKGSAFCVSLTVAKRQGPYAYHQNDRHRLPQTTAYVRLYTLIRFAKTCVHQRTSRLPTGKNSHRNDHAVRSRGIQYKQCQQPHGHDSVQV